MLQIRLSNKGPPTEGGGGPKSLPVETVTVACPDHLVLADLPVAKSLGSATAASLIKTVGRRSRRQLGERVHFCVGCDYPIAIYGRLSPCEHAFCLDCARSDSICYLCDERIQKIQTIKMMEGIFICAAPHCLKSFLKKTDFESHIHNTHADLLQPNNTEKEDGNESEPISTKPQPPQPPNSTSDSSVRPPPRPVAFSPNSNSEDKTRRQQPQPPRPIIQPPKPPPPQTPQFFGQLQNYPTDPPSYNRFHQQNMDSQQDSSNQFSDKQQQVNNYVVPVNSNPGLTPVPQFSYPAFPADGSQGQGQGQQFYNASYGSDSVPMEVGSEQGSLLGYPPGQAVNMNMNMNMNMNFPGSYPQGWNMGAIGMSYEAQSGVQGSTDGFAYFQQGMTLNSITPLANKGMESMQGDGKGVLAAQPLPPPPLQPPQFSQVSNRGKFYSGDMGHDGQGFGFGTGQE